MAKIDFKKTMPELYNPPTNTFTVLTVPPLRFLMVDGSGDPNLSGAYADALKALYSVSYKLKFMSKQQLARDYVVPPQQALWWASDMDVFVSRDKDAWQWKAMIMQPDWITEKMYQEAKELVEKKPEAPTLTDLRFDTYDEGLSVQIMHIGSYDDEGPTIRRLHDEFLPENGLEENGRHHEIYLNDPRRTDPNNLRTVLRQPVRKCAA